MKKILALVLAMCMVFALCACGQKAEAPAAAPAAEKTATEAAPAEEKATVDFPTKQITVICPLAAGGGSDAISRLYAAELQNVTGVSVVVENMPGAGTGIGLEAIASADPDGYTIGYIPAEVTTVKVMGNAEVTPEDFTFLGSCMKIRALICVPADSEWNSLEDYIAAAKANPGAVTIGTAGVGNAYELGLRQFMESAGIELNVVNFSGGTAEAITAMLGGNVQSITAGTAEALSYVESGQFKILCHLSAERSSFFPDVPTATELGYACDGGSWGAFALPNGVDEDIVKILTDATEKVMTSDSLLSAMKERGFDEYYHVGDEFKAEAEASGAINSAIVEKFNLSVN